MNFSSVSLALVVACLSGSGSAWADTRQELLKVDGDVHFAIESVHAATEFPLSITLDVSGAIKSVNIGDKESKVKYSDASLKSNVATLDFPVVEANMDALQKPIDVSEKFAGINFRIAQIDASKLDKNTGGDLTIKYPTSIFTFWSLQSIELTVRRDPKTNKWVAYRRGSLDKPVDRVRLGDGNLRLGIGAAQYENGYDPANPEKILSEHCHGVGPSVCVTSYRNGSVLASKSYKNPSEIFSQFEPVVLDVSKSAR